MGLNLFFLTKKKKKKKSYGYLRKSKEFQLCTKKNPVFVKPAVMFPGVIEFKSH